jgi:hypothetical protein
MLEGDMKRILRVLAVAAIAVFVALPSVALAQSTSPSYGVDEVFFGSGGELNACSAGGEYCSKQSAGELTVGNTSSESYEAQAGFNTTDQPLLEVAVPDAVVDFGELDVQEESKDSATFQVRTYLASGYQVYLVGTAPKISAHTMDGMGDGTEGAPSMTGIEQFGINLVDVPIVQVPDLDFSFGVAGDLYDDAAVYAWPDTADETRAIAMSNKSSGQTNYTMTMVANMSGVTPAGVYMTALSVVVVPTF